MIGVCNAFPIRHKLLDISYEFYPYGCDKFND